MDTVNLKLFKRYAVHTFFQWFSHSLLVTFSALFIYVKTGSIGLALLAQFAGICADLMIRSPLVEWWWNSVLKRKQILAMVVGMTITAIASLGIFFVNTSHVFSITFLVFFSWLSSVGTSIYWIPSSALFYNSIGNSNAPGKYTAIISIVRIFSAMLAAIVSLVLNIENNFIFLLPVLAGVALVSIIPLKNLKVLVTEPVSWHRAVRKISWKTFWANFIGDNEIRTCGIPLVLVLMYGSISKPVFIGATTLIVAALFGYFAGKFKDRNNKALFIWVLIGSVFVWIAYTVVKAPVIFVILGSLEYISITVINIGRDARAGRETANNNNPIESALAIEFARGIGTMAGLMLLILAYFITGTLPQFILFVAILFIIPKGLYAIGVLDKLRSR